jgi:glycosyltransferase involved in cell wall biosynthesis
MQERQLLRVGVTEWHGMMLEQAENPPQGVEYVSAKRKPSILHRLIKSPIKGFLPVVDDRELDLVESIISPAICRVPWVCSVANYQEVIAFSIVGLPTPKALRQLLVGPMFRSRQFLAFVFWSEAGRRTMTEYGGIGDANLLKKAKVVYPAVARRRDREEGRHERNLLLFSGDFFRKGGVHVVDAFERLQPRYPGIRLRLCCDPELDFRCNDTSIRREMIDRIAKNRFIEIGRVSRAEIVEVLLPRAIAYLLPTYDETFGFAVLEAMAAGCPVIATKEFALPEMIDHEKNGWLLEYSESDKRRLVSGYVVKGIPRDLRIRISEELCARLELLLVDTASGAVMGRAGQVIARTKFSVERRGELMSEIYRSRCLTSL